MRPLVTSLFLIAALPVWASDLCRVERVSLHEEQGATTLRIETDAPANFTSFKLSHPPRVIVDFPEARAENGHQDFPRSPLRRWQLESHEDSETPLVRLTVTLADDADYTLQADGTILTLRLQAPTGRPLVALDEHPREVSTPELPPPDFAALAAQEEALRLERKARLEKETREREEATRLELEHQARLETERIAKVESLRLQKEQQAREQARLESEESLRLQKEQLARKPVENTPPQPESLSLSKLRHHVAADRAPASLEQLSFRRVHSKARVLLRTSEPVVWSLVEESPRHLLFELPNTLIPAAINRLPLDTRYFDTPVLRIVPMENRQARSTRVLIELGSDAHWSAAHVDGALALDIGAPAALAGSDNW